MPKVYRCRLIVEAKDSPSLRQGSKVHDPVRHCMAKLCAGLVKMFAQSCLLKPASAPFLMPDWRCFSFFELVTTEYSKKTTVYLQRFLAGGGFYEHAGKFERKLKEDTQK